MVTLLNSLYFLATDWSSRFRTFLDSTDWPQIWLMYSLCLINLWILTASKPPICPALSTPSRTNRWPDSTHGWCILYKTLQFTPCPGLRYLDTFSVRPLMRFTSNLADALFTCLSMVIFFGIPALTCSPLLLNPPVWGVYPLMACSILIQ